MRSITMDRRGWSIAAGIVVLLALGLYLGGRWQERSRAVVMQENLREQIVGMTQERDRIRAELTAAQVQISLLRARSLLFETALDLERRNFGTANQRLNAAGEQLAGVGPAGAGADLDSLRREIAETDLRVAENLAEQRARVLEFAARLDEILESARSPAPPGS